MMNFCEKMTLRGFLFVVCLFTSIVASADDATLKTPYLTISKMSYGEEGGTPTFFNDRQFEEPALNVYENKDSKELVTNRFMFSFYLTSDAESGTKGDAVTDKEKKEWSVDAKTGTRVNVRTGDVETGSKPGVVFIHVRITPRDAYKTMFATAEECYSIRLNKIKADAPARVLPSFVADEYKTSWTAATGSVIALPQLSLQYSTTKNNTESVHDLKDKYMVTANADDAGKSLLTIEDYTTTNLYGKSVTAPVIKIGNTPGKAIITLKIAPKDGNGDRYDAVSDYTIDLNIVDAKVKPHLVFAQERQVKYTGMQGDSVQRPTVYDQFGNDISASCAAYQSDANNKPLWLAWTALDLDGKAMHDVPNQNWYTPVLYVDGGKTQSAPDNVYRLGDGPQIYGMDQLNVGGTPFYKDSLENEFCQVPSNEWDSKNQCRLANYDANIYCMVYPNPNNAEAKDKYEVTEDKYVINIGPRPVDLVLTPDPSSIKFANGVEMDFKNFFDVKARFVSTINDTWQGNPSKPGDVTELSHYTEDNGKNTGFGFNYTMKFKRDTIQLVGYPYEDNPQYHVVVDKDNNVVDPNTYDGEMWDVYWAILKHGGNGDWKMLFPKTGKFDLEFGLSYYNKGWYSSSTKSVIKTITVEESITPVITVTPDPLVIYTTDTELPSQPVVKITDLLGKDIMDNYTYTFDASTLPVGMELDKNGDIVIKLDANGKPTTKKGDWDKVKVIATPKDPAGKYAKCETTFRIIVKDLGERTRFEWDVYNEYGTSRAATEFLDSDKTHGKLVFTKAGTVSGGYTIDAIPGLSVTLGQFNENDGDDSYWSADLDEDGRVYVGDGTVLLDDKGIPTHGTYFKLTPRTNGFLYVDADYKAGHNVVLISADASKKQTITESGDGEKTDKFSLPLTANTTYYLYDEANSALKLHGLNFIPAFVRFENDNAPIESATAYANGFAGELPKLVNSGSKPDVALISYGLHGHEVNGAQAPYKAYVDFDANSGYVSTSGSSTYQQFTACTGDKLDDNFKALPTMENRIKVYAKVKSAWKSDIMQIPYYDLYVGAIPTYIVENGEIPNVRQVVSTENYPTHINAIFGGWENDDDKPYFKNNKSELEALVDSWKVAKKDSVGQNNRTVDNFSYASFGTQNPTSENVDKYKYNATDEDLTYQLPCRGTYAQFEPRENGTLLVYIIQNGMIAWDGNEENKDKSGNNKAKLNSVYITDETGQPVKLSAFSDNQGVTDGDGNAAYTEAIVRCSYKELIDNCYDGKDLNTSDAKAKSDEEALKLLKKVGYMPVDATTEGTIKRGDIVKVYDVAKELGTGEPGTEGYSVISKAYTRYSFKVKAGKTYFVFMNGSKIGNNGFAFLPDGWQPGRQEPTLETVVLDEKGTGSDSKDEFVKNTEAFNHYDKAVNVKLYHSGLKAGQWTSICLPFSMSESQFKKTFGDDAWIISFDNVVNQETIDGVVYDNVASFTQHCYHWIVAGRPYFIRPGKTFAPAGEDGGRSYILCDSVTFEHATYDAEGNGTGYVMAKTLKQEKESFHFVGNYDVTQMKVGDYFIGYGLSDTGETEAKLFRDDQGWALNGYRAHISLEQAGAKLNSMHIGEIDDQGGNATSYIADIFNEPTRVSLSKAMNGVYAIDGAKISDKASDIDSLPAGVYIVNGKCIVK